MPQISFTPRNSDVYDRFSRLLLEEQLKRGKLTAPQFLDIVLDGWEKSKKVKVISFHPDMELSDFVKNVVHSAVKDIADSESNEKVIIKQSDGAQYLEKMLAHNHNAYLTPHKDEAMVFDSRDQAKAFLRKCGHEVGNWILEPVNESK